MGHNEYIRSIIALSMSRTRNGARCSVYQVVIRRFVTGKLVTCIKRQRFDTGNTEGGCEISSSHGGEYDVQSCVLGCTAV
jgi:hypothetical protein